jgi:hypothetical protein
MSMSEGAVEAQTRRASAPLGFEPGAMPVLCGQLRAQDRDGLGPQLFVSRRD